MATKGSFSTTGGKKVSLKVTAVGAPMKVSQASGSSAGLRSPQGKPRVIGSRRIAR
jgi:hypothetical protein